MKKMTIISIIISLVAFIVLPLAVVFIIGGMDALGIMLLLLFAFNPIVSIIIGILSGKSGKVQWYLPVISALIFLISETVLIGFDFSYIIAVAVYVGLGLAAAYITAAIKNKKKVAVSEE